MSSSPSTLSRLLARAAGLAAVPALACFCFGQAGSAGQSPVQAPVSYSSISQLTSLLAQLQQTSQTTQIDLAKLRVDKFKADSSTKHEIQSNVESIQRNLQNALPAIMNELRAAPESLPSSFKLYRNLDALYDVFRSVTESAGAFGSKDDYQSLGNDITNLEHSRRALADRLEALATTKENELGQLRTQIRNLQATVNSAPPKKIVVDDNEPVKKPATRKKSTTSKPQSNSTTPAKPQ